MHVDFLHEYCLQNNSKVFKCFWKYKDLLVKENYYQISVSTSLEVELYGSKTLDTYIRFWSFFKYSGILIPNSVDSSFKNDFYYIRFFILEVKYS